MKISNIFILLTLWTFGHTITAQSDQDQSLLWKLKGDHIQTSYIFGTMHLLPQEQFKLKEKVAEAFKTSQQIVLELDMDAPDLQTSIMQHMPMKDSQTLDQLMKEEDYAKLDETLQSLMGVSVKMFNTWKPFGVSSMLYTKYINGQPASFEGTFIGMAKKQEKEILGLETVAEQMQVFDNIPYSEQIKDVVDMLYEEDRNQSIFSEMVDLYLKEDVQGVYQFTLRFLDTEQEQRLMLDDRNQKWVPRIGEMAQYKSTFFGVGAAHLGGEQGIINLLKEAGYTVTPVN